MIRHAIKFLLLAITLLAVASGCSGPHYKHPPTYTHNVTADYGTTRHLDLAAAEVYVAMHHNSGMVYIREYKISTLINDKKEIAEQVNHIRSLVENKQYCKEKFGFKHYKAVSEAMTNYDGYIMGECMLQPNGSKMNFNENFADIFSNVLGRPVTVTVSSQIGLHFYGPDIEVRGNNALRVIKHKDDPAKQVIFWTYGLKEYEIVLGSSINAQDDYNSILPYFGEDIGNPAQISSGK